MVKVFFAIIAGVVAAVTKNLADGTTMEMIILTYIIYSGMLNETK